MHVLQQQRDCLQHWLKYLSKERFLNPEEVKFEKNLGKGKHGVVYEATFSGHPCAAKCFQPTDMNSFLHELEVAAHCKHQNLLHVLGGTVKDGFPLLVCELHNGSLSLFIEEYRKARGGLPEKLILSLTRDIAKGLIHIHSKKLVHQDLKSDNVLVREMGDDSWKAIVSDFGTVNNCTNVTMPNVGSPKYRAPDERQTYKMDIFSLGLVVLEMAIGKKPDQSRLEEQLNKVKSESLDKLIKRCTALDHTKRYSGEDVKFYCEERLKNIDKGCVPLL
ncbi:probable serine/threonine-protein kinase DDB_G0280461 [Stylophora pistillata]|nr:probable serine/threonine-protein kinase DDB_G0280461 [Stylophora pistillata]